MLDPDLPVRELPWRTVWPSRAGAGGSLDGRGRAPGCPPRESVV